MTTDLHDEVRRALADEAHEVEVPPIDQVAFQQHLRTARRDTRRRQARWAAVGTGVVAAGVVGTIVATSLITGSHEVVVADGPATFAAADSPTPPALLVGNGTVQIVDDGSTYSANIEIGRGGPQDVYRTVDGLLVVDGQSSPLRVPIQEASGDAPFEVGKAIRLASAVDNLSVSADGRTGAWFALDEGKVRFVLYDFAKNKEAFSKPVPTDGVLDSIVAVSGDSALVMSDEELQEWTSDGENPLSFGASPDALSFSSNAGIVASARSDRSATDVFANNGTELQKLATVPVASGEISPTGDNVVGFTLYAVDGLHFADQDRRYVEVWSSDGERRSSFTGLPKTVYEFAWLDNDTIALTGGPGAGSWPGELDTYTCELANLTCTKVSDDETGPDDRMPMLASGRGL